MTPLRRPERSERPVNPERVVRGTATCPRCAVTMTQRSIGGGSFGLGYARKREWFICPSCHRSVIFDVKRGTRN